MLFPLFWRLNLTLHFLRLVEAVGPLLVRNFDLESDWNPESEVLMEND